MGYTLNKIVDILAEYAANDYRVNDFFFGDLWEYAEKKLDRFPLMLATLKDSEISERLDRTNLQIGFFDRVDKDEAIELGVLSDTKEMAKGFCTYINSPSFKDFLISSNLRLTSFTERFDHELSGHFFDIQISQQFENDVCALPVSGMPTYSSSQLVTIINQNGTVIATLIGGQSYTVEQLTEIIDTIDGNTTTVIDPI
jgi:hypothetical protein